MSSIYQKLGEYFSRQSKQRMPNYLGIGLAVSLIGIVSVESMAMRYNTQAISDIYEADITAAKTELVRDLRHFQNWCDKKERESLARIAQRTKKSLPHYSKP